MAITVRRVIYSHLLVLLRFACVSNGRLRFKETVCSQMSPSKHCHDSAKSFFQRVQYMSADARWYNSLFSVVPSSIHGILCKYCLFLKILSIFDTVHWEQFITFEWLIRNKMFFLRYIWMCISLGPIHILIHL